MGDACLCIDGIPLKNNEASKDVLDSVKNLFEFAKVNIPDVVINRAHRIGRIYKERASNKNCKTNNSEIYNLQT